MRSLILIFLSAAFLVSCQLEPYLGTWKVAGTHSKNDPLKLTGTIASYQRGHVRFGEKEYHDVYFERRAIQHSDFYKKYNIQPNEIGLRGTYSLEVMIFRENKQLEDVGTFFIIKDMKTLLMPAGGEFYILEKVE